MNSNQMKRGYGLLFGMIFALASAIASGQEGPPSTKVATQKQLTAGDHLRTLVVDDLERSAIVHIPPGYSPEEPTPIVLAIHGYAMRAVAMVGFSGLNETADEKGFVVVYPNGTGPKPLMSWNAGGFTEGVGTRADDIQFFKKLLDDLSSVINVDQKRIYACGMSNGGMMCYRLAAEMSDRIAAIAPVAGTMPNVDMHPNRPVSVIHFHGTRDKLVPYEMDDERSQFWLNLKSVAETIQNWIRLDGCSDVPASVDVLSKPDDDLVVTRQIYGPGKENTEVVLVTIEGGGHTWPGQVPPFRLLGESTMSVSANQMIWEFFEKHPLK